MKKILSLALAFAMVLSLGLVSLALSPGEAVIKDPDGGSNFDYVVSRVVPGETVYIYVADADDYSGSNKAPTSAKNNLDCISNDSGKTAKIISTSTLKVERKRVDSGEYGMFAVLAIKSVSASDYEKADGYTVSGSITYDGDIIDVDFDIEYAEEDADGSEFFEELTFYKTESGGDIYITFDDGEFTGASSGSKSVLASLKTDYNSTIGNKYSNADLDFYNFGGADFSGAAKNGATLKIEASSGMYLYEISGSTLTDLTNTYDRTERAFVINTRKLGSYVVSDTALSGSVAAASSSSSIPSSSQSSSSSSQTTTQPKPGVPINPGTGAAA